MIAIILSVIMLTCSWYGPGFEGRPTASGEIYDQTKLTAAHTTLPFGTELVLVRDTKRVTVRITDRGPYCFEALEEGYLAPHPTRQLDLSRAAFAELAPLTEGIIEVEVYHAPPPVMALPPGVEWEECH